MTFLHIIRSLSNELLLLTQKYDILLLIESAPTSHQHKESNYNIEEWTEALLNRTTFLEYDIVRVVPPTLFVL